MRLATVLRREFQDMRRNKSVVFPMLVTPLLFSGMLIFFAVKFRDPRAPAQLLEGFLREFMVLYLVLPMSLPSLLAAFSIIGEKQQKTLEPVLATPVSTGELLLGKTVAAVIPAVLVTWAAWGLTAAITGVLLAPRFGHYPLLSAEWLLCILVLGPLAALMSAGLCVTISSRAKDVRSAQQVAALVVVPLVFFAAFQISGRFALDVTRLLWGAAFIAAADVVLFRIGVRLFAREYILTRWR